MKGRESLGQMLQDLKEGRAEYSIILVCDVSRWGRFQKTDESAVYEYACQQAGVFVHEQCRSFSNVQKYFPGSVLVGGNPDPADGNSVQTELLRLQFEEHLGNGW
jgi:hypothetical protein